MGLLAFVAYLAVELTALVWLASTVGILWTILIVIAASALGMVLMRSQGRRVLAEFRKVNAGERSPGGAVADGALVAIGSILMVVPGLVSSVIGLLLLIPLSRSILRPVVSLFAARRYGRAVARQGFTPGFGTTAPDFGQTSQFRGTKGSFETGHVVIDADVTTDDRTR